MKCTYCGQDGHFAIKCFRNPQGESYKGKPASWAGVKKLQFNDMNATEAELKKNSNHDLKARGSTVIISPEPQRRIMLN